MKKHPYRAIMIWAVVIVALINIYPTVGWMLCSQETRDAKLQQWQEEDDARAAQKPGAFQEMMWGAKRWAQFDRERVINLGLDLQGGIHMVVSFDPKDLDEERLQEYKERKYTDAQIEEEVQQIVLQQIQRRVNDFEAKEPIIQALGTNQVQVQLPGEKDVERARNLIKKTALLNFHIVAGVDETLPVFSKIKEKFPEQFIPFVNQPVRRGDPFTVPVEHFARVQRVLEKANANTEIVPETKMLAFSQAPKQFEEQQYELYLIDREPIARGEGLTSAMAIPDDSNPPYWQILFAMNNAAASSFADATEQNIGRPMAIVIDGLVISAPVIRDRIGGGRGQISGSFEALEARDLAIALNSGSMVVPVHEEFTRVIGPTLGRELIRKGVRSSVVGIVIVGIFMLLYYHMAGLVALAALVLNAVTVIAAMAYFDMTLTLPGIAGLILTVGMAVDANVLIFERIREELKLGHSLVSSVESGFSRATVTILDANVTTLIAAVVLMQFGTGPIEGFAVTLSIGVCASVFAALVVSRALLDFLVSSHTVSKLTMLSIVKPDTKVPFMRARMVTAVISVVVILIGLGMFTVRGKDNFGVDFTEGTNIQLSLPSDTPVPVADVRAALMDAGFTSPIVQESADESLTSSNEFMIRVGDINAPAVDTDGTPGEASMMTSVAERMQQACAPFTTSGAAADVQIVDEQTVGPAVGAQLRKDAVLAMLWSLIFIVVYLTIRFELKFACGAVVALIHDVLITVGVFALLRRQITMPVIAALLTIIGYSLNDTIVVFDRIREDMGVYRGRGYKFLDILNIAINSTLSRTLLTSLTTLFVVVVLFIFGGSAINDFALALILGVLVGTYSSIFIASPVVYLWQVVQGKHQLSTDTGKADTAATKKNPKKGTGGSKSKASKGARV